MADMLTAAEFAAGWGLTTRRVTGLCRSGKIPG